ncbi:MAG: hypothetical protein JWQ74_3601 [Marmoricola sp.]|nr:hypothetical protein [Marmoricola sp.]
MAEHRNHSVWHQARKFVSWRLSSIGVFGYLLFGVFGVCALGSASYQLATGSYARAAGSLGIAIPVVVLFYLPMLWRVAARRILGKTVSTPWLAETSGVGQTSAPRSH